MAGEIEWANIPQADEPEENDEIMVVRPSGSPRTRRVPASSITGGEVVVYDIIDGGHD